MAAPRRTAILTGASRGIGYAVASALASDGYSLVLNSRDPEGAAARLRQACEGEVLAVGGDISAPETTGALVEAARQIGGVDALLLNHGGPPLKSFVDVSEEEWDRYFRIIVQGPLRLLRESVPLFRERGGGRVVAITSFTTKAPIPGLVLSNSLRAGLLNALKTAAQELGPEGILINAVAPGYIATERLVEWTNSVARQKEMDVLESRKKSAENIPLKRFGTPEELAEVITFLLSAKNGYLTGQQILVDGGLVTSP
jgi:3-oxoacyl-[acyl-carrier protein] reductase